MYNFTQEETCRDHTWKDKRSKLDSTIQTPPNKQAKYSNAILQETLLLSKNQNQANAREREKRIRKNEEEEVYL